MKSSEALPSIEKLAVIQGVVILAFLKRVLFGSLWGFFALAAFAYLLFWLCGAGFTPFTFSQLLVWADELDHDYKVALLGTVITVVGFIVAFHLATVNWRDQMRQQLMMQSADEIHRFYSDVCRQINKMTPYVSAILETGRKIDADGATFDTEFAVVYQSGRAQDFLNARDLLSQMAIEAHGLLGRHAVVLFSLSGMLTSAEKANEAISDVVDRMWFVVPLADKSDPNKVATFRRQLDVDRCTEFVEFASDQALVISSLSGGIKGRLTAPILQVSGSMVRGFSDLRRLMRTIKETAPVKPARSRPEQAPAGASNNPNQS